MVVPVLAAAGNGRGGRSRRRPGAGGRATMLCRCGSSCGAARARPWRVCPRGRWAGLLVASLVRVVCSAGRSKLGCPLDHQPAGMVGGERVFRSSTRPYPAGTGLLACSGRRGQDSGHNCAVHSIVSTGPAVTGTRRWVFPLAPLLATTTTPRGALRRTRSRPKIYETWPEGPILRHAPPAWGPTLERLAPRRVR